MKYWNNQGLYEDEAKELNTLVPAMGKADTFKGEIWRAATKIYYDYFNNGFGNEWKPVAEFLMDNIQLPSRVEMILLSHANGNIAHEKFDYDMDLMIDTVIVRLRDVEDRANVVDMWEYRSTNDHHFAENEWDCDEYHY